MADELIAHLKMRSETEPDKPFLISNVPGSTHAPHHPQKGWTEQFKASSRWMERAPAMRFRQPKKIALIPPDAKLIP